MKNKYNFLVWLK